MTAFVLDTETTGLTEPRPVEIAWLRLGEASDPCILDQFRQRYHPGKQIEYGAMATHHITAEDVEWCPSWTTFSLPPDAEFLIGHNVDYDARVIGRLDIKRIDTLALSRSLWPTLDSHRLGALIYFLQGAEAQERLHESQHSPLFDAECCRDILVAILDHNRVDSWQALWEVSEAARVPTVMAMGKHKGLPIADLPPDYIAWFLRQPDVDPYLRKALEGVPVT